MIRLYYKISFYVTDWVLPSFFGQNLQTSNGYKEKCQATNTTRWWKAISIQFIATMYWKGSVCSMAVKIRCSYSCVAPCCLKYVYIYHILQLLNNTLIQILLVVDIFLCPVNNIIHISDHSNCSSRNLRVVNWDQVERLMDGPLQSNDRSLPRVTRIISTSNNSPMPTVPPTDPPSREKFMKQHLIFLLHASKCDKRDKLRMSKGETVTSVSKTMVSCKKWFFKYI